MEQNSEDEGSAPLSLQPEWADVEPLPQDDGPHPVVAIQYQPEHEEVFGYFRAILAAGELSARALRLTEEVIGINSAHYTAWEWRWRCLEALRGADGNLMQRELGLMRRVALGNPKNYQLWNHRRRVALSLGPAQAPEELEFAGQCLRVDAKNYHAWSHRQAMVGAFQLWHQELAFVEALLEEDPANNSTWNQRFFCICHLADSSKAPAEVYASELPYVVQHILKGVNNQSAWNYLRGVATPDILAHDAAVFEMCSKVLEHNPSCSPALALLAEVYAAQASVAARQQNQPTASVAALQASTMLERLQVADPLRSHYWELRMQQLRAIIATC